MLCTWEQLSYKVVGHLSYKVVGHLSYKVRCLTKSSAFCPLVVVIPKEGLAGAFFGYDTDYKIALFCFKGLYFVVGVIPKEGLAGPILLMV